MSERVDRAFYSLPRYYQSSQITEEIIRAAMKEFDYDEQERDDIFVQLIIATATWGLERWEKEFGVQHAPGDSYELRRARLEAKVISKSKSNPKRMEEIVNSFVPSKKAIVYRIPNEYAFEALVPAGELQWIKEIYEAVEKAKPAHMEFILTGKAETISLSVEGNSYSHTVDCYICDTIYPEDNAEGYIGTETLVIDQQAHAHKVDFSIVETIYAEQEEPL